MVLDSQQLIRRHLTDTFLRLSRKNPAFSLRAFAKRLGISNSALSELMRGKRKVAKKTALSLAAKMELSSKQLAELEKAFTNKHSLESLKPIDNPLREVLITPDRFHVMADWRYFALLALLRGSRGKLSNAEMAEALGLAEEEVAALSSELFRLGLIARQANGELVAERVVFRTSEEFPDELMRSRRLQSLEGARIAIEQRLPGESGYFSTISADPARIAAAEAMIEDFLKRLSLYLRDPDSHEVFELSINLFPRTSRRPGKRSQ